MKGKINDHLDEREQTIMKKVGMVKLVRRSMKVYNKLCPTCKQLILKNPKTPISAYCDECKIKAEKILGGLIK